MNVSKMMKNGVKAVCVAGALSCVAKHFSKGMSLSAMKAMPPVMTAIRHDGFMQLMWEFPMSDHIAGYSVRLDSDGLILKFHCLYPELVLVTHPCAPGNACMEKMREITVVAHYDNGTAAEISKLLDGSEEEPEEHTAPGKGSD